MPFCIDLGFSRSVGVFCLFVLLSCFQNKACVILVRYVTLALMYVAVWSIRN